MSFVEFLMFICKMAEVTPIIEKKPMKGEEPIPDMTPITDKIYRFIDNLM